MIALASQRLLAAATLGLLAGLPLSPTRAAAQAAPASNPEVPPTIGEPPTAPTAEDMALRDQRIVLKGGKVTVDLGAFYSYGERSSSFVREERRAAGSVVSVRVGLMDDLQATLRLPSTTNRDKVFVINPGGGTAAVAVSSATNAGDTTLSLRGVALHEAVGRPTLIVSLDAVAPTGPGDRGVGMGLVLSKSYDPAVIFASLNYMRGLNLDPADPRRSLPKHRIGLAMGYTYAVNDALALSSIFAASLRNTVLKADGSVPPSRESFQLQLGLTWSIARGLFIEPGVALRVGSDVTSTAVSMNIAYTY